MPEHVDAAALAAAMDRAAATVADWADRMVATVQPTAEALQRAQEPELPTTERVVAAIDAAVGHMCAGPGCRRPLGPDSPSAYFCSPTCQDAWGLQQTTSPHEVRGSVDVAVGPARWRPDLVDTFDDTGWMLLDSHHRDDTGLSYNVYTGGGVAAFLRVDDGNRFVGVQVLWAELEQSGPSEPFRRLEREIGDRRRLDPASGASDPGGVYWSPDPPADMDNLTVADLQQMTRLGHIAHPGATPPGRFVGPTVRRVGEHLAAAGGSAIAAFQWLPARVRQAIHTAVQEETARANLRAICADEAMYDRAVAEAERLRWTLPRMAEAVAAGWYTESGWAGTVPREFPGGRS